MANKYDDYVPGVCNIGKAEIRSRKQSGWVFGVLTFVIATVMVFYNMPLKWRLVLFFPATLSALYFIQAYSHFCVGFGMGGVFNFGDKLRKTTAIEQKEFMRQDRKKVLQIIAYSILIGGIETGIIAML